MRSILALMRAAWLTGLSYRLATVISLAGLLASVVPIYFISNAVQDVAEASIALEGGQYFAFIVFGTAAMYVLAAALSALPSALSGSIGSGTFESLLVTRTPLPLLLIGMAGYPLLQSLLRAALLLGGALVLGVQLRWTMLPPALGIVALTITAYASIGLLAASLILVFRTAGPLITVVTSGSALLGGAYYSTTVIPGWLQSLSGIVPLTYALRSVRRLLLGDASLVDVSSDVGMLALLAVTGLAIGMLVFGAALQHARRAGTLSQY
ncbi:MAG: ABC transporter permease [Gemmatimonadaceae bacterium]|nr:ABC transporter permease [Gemmatimonadaceae bacterium]